MHKTRLSFSQSKLFTAAAFVAAASLSIARAQSPTILPTVTTLANAASAGFGNTLSAAVMDNYGNVYVTDSSNNVIRRIDPSGTASIFAGGVTTVCGAATDTVGDGCPANQATLIGPTVVRIYKGDFYILDVGTNRVRMVSGSTGIISTYAGDGTNTNGETFASTVASCTATTTGCGLKAPVDMAFDANGNLYVQDAGGTPYVQRIDWVTKQQTYYAGSGKQLLVGDGLPAACPTNTVASTAQTACASFMNYGGLAVDAAGHLYISEGQSVNNVRWIPIPGEMLPGTGGNPPAAATVTTYVGQSGVGTAGAGTDGSPALGQATLKQPLRISFDLAGNLYIADSMNFRIRKVVPGTGLGKSGVISTVVGTGVAIGTTNGQVSLQAALGLPADVEFTPAGDMLIVDRTNAAVLLSAPGGHFSSFNVGTAAATQNIYALTSAASGTFTVAGSTDFTVSTTTCSASTVYGAVGNICQAVVTFTPSHAGRRVATAVFTDASSASVTSDLTGIGIAPAVVLLPGTVTTIAGTGATGSTGDSGNATAAKLNLPAGAAVDASGNIYVADSGNNTVRKFAVGGVITSIAGTAGSAGFSGDGAAATSAKLSAPSAVALDGAGNLYIADTGNNRVRVVNAVTGFISTFAGTGTLGYTGDNGLATSATLNAPSGLAVGSNGVLYIADTGNNVVRFAGMRGGSIGTYAGNGTAAFSGDGSSASLASLNGPSGLAVDVSGTLYIADTNNHVIRSVSTTGSIATVAGSNSAGFNGDGSATSFQLNAPKAVAVDAGKNLYIADTANNRIRIVTGGALVTVGGGATAGSSGDAGISTQATFSGLQGIALDASGNVIIVDTVSNKVRAISASSSVLAFPTTNPTSTSPAQTERALNAGNASLNIVSVAVPSGFVQQTTGSSDCAAAAAVNAGNACVLQLAFNPSAVGPYSGNVVLTDNAQAQAGVTQNIVVTGVSAAVFAAAFSSGLPTTVTAGASRSVTVSITNPAATYTGTVHFTSSDSRAVLPADYTFTVGDAGSHTFTGLQLKTVGIQAVTVTDTIDSTITASTSTTVAAGAVATLAVASGNNQSVDLTASFQPLSVVATDSFGNPVPSASVTFTAPSSGASLTFANSTATDTELTNVNGIATSTVARPIPIVGSYSVQASAGGSITAGFTAGNTSSVAAGFTLSPSNTTAPYGLQPGGSETVTLSLTPVGGFYGTVTLSCTAPATSACSLNPTSIPPAVGTPTSFQLTLTTQRDPDTKGIATPAAAAFGIMGIALLGLRRRRKIFGLLLFLLSLSAVSIIGCGGGTHTTNNSSYGPYVVTVTATAGSITSNTTVTFLVPGS